MKYRFYGIITVVFFLAGLYPLSAESQPNDTFELVIFPVELETIDEDYAELLAEMFYKTGRFEIITLSNILIEKEDDLPYRNQYIDESAFAEMGAFIQADSGILVEVLQFTAEKDSIRPATLLEVRIDVMDFNTGLINCIENFSVERADVISMIGDVDDEQQVQNATLNLFEHRVKRVFKNLFHFKSDLLAIDGDDIFLEGGFEDGIGVGDVFKIFEEKEQPTSLNLQEPFEVHEKAVARVKSVGIKTNRSQILRRWDSLHPGNKATEVFNSTNQVQLNVIIPSQDAIYGIELNWRLDLWRKWGLSFRFAGLQDSRTDRDIAFGIGGFILKPIFHVNRHQLSVKARLNFDYVTRTDDDDNIIGAFLFSASPGLNYVFNLTKKYDLVIGANYIVAGASDWERPSSDEQEEERPVIWDRKKPKLNLESLYLTVGFNFNFF